MVALKTLTFLAAAGSVLAAPQGHYHGDGQHGNLVTINDVVYTTVMVTVTAGQDQPSATPAPAQPTPAQPETPVAAATTPAAAAAFTPEASPAPAASSSSSSSSGGTGTYMDTVNEYRGKMGLSDLSESDQLQGNALKTCQDSGGQLNHELNPGSMAQVLAPADCDPSQFLKVFVGGWLCEMPSLPGLDGICSSLSQGWSYDGQTGHAEILSSTSYSKIGCACAEGIWGCDLA